MEERVSISSTLAQLLSEYSESEQLRVDTLELLALALFRTISLRGVRQQLSCDWLLVGPLALLT